MQHMKLSKLSADLTTSPMASSMFAPSVEAVLTEFHTSSAAIGTFIVSGYLLGYAFGPLFIAPMSELYGRLPVYHLSTLGFILFNVACAKSTNIPMLIVFRIMSGVCGCTPLTLGPGSIADMFKQEVRGKILSIWVLPIMLGPTVGPIVGGYLSEARGWRWDFWFLVILVSIPHISRYPADNHGDWSSVCTKSHSPARDESNDDPRTTSEAASQINRKSQSEISNEVEQDPEGTLHPLDYSTHQDPHILPSRSCLFSYRGCCIWHSLSHLHNHDPSLRRSIRHQQEQRWPHLPRHGYWPDDRNHQFRSRI